MQVQQSDEDPYLQNYQTTLGQSTRLQQRSRTSSSTPQKELSTVSSKSERQQQQPPAEQGSYQYSKGISNSPSRASRQGSSALDEDSGLIAAIQSPVPHQEDQQPPAAVRAKPRKSVVAKPAAGIARGASVADRLKNLRGLMSNDTAAEQDGMGRGDEIQEDLPYDAVQDPADFGNVDEPIPEEVQMAV